MRVFFLVLVLLAPVNALALQPADFARGFQLEINTATTLQQLELPWAVFAASKRPDLADMRIFNARGEEVPLHVRSIAPEVVVLDDVALPIFRIAETGKGKNEYDLRMKVRTSAQGTVLDTRIKQAAGSSEQVLLLDASANGQDLSAIRFELTADLPMTTVTIQGSNDLFGWTWVGSGVLTRIGDQSARILQDRIAVSEERWKYYLVTAQSSVAALGYAFGVPVQGLGPEARRWAALQGKAVEPGVQEFVLPAALPADLLDVDGNQTAMLGVTVSVPAGGDAWRNIFGGTLYRMPQNGQLLSSMPIFFRGRPAHFRVTFQGGVAPLRIGWIARELVFMPQGEGPFLLAVGKADVAVRPEVLASMLAMPSLKDVKPGLARISTELELPGANPAPPETDGKRYILWAVLGLGVVLLGGMAWNLVRGLKPRQ